MKLFAAKLRLILHREYLIKSTVFIYESSMSKNNTHSRAEQKPTFNRHKKRYDPRRDVVPIVEAPRSKILWDNGLSVNFPSQQRLVEDEFKKAQVWDVLSGNVSEEFIMDHPEPFFMFGLEMPNTDPDDPEFHQPDLDPTKSADASVLTILKSAPEYYQMLGYFNNRRSIWSKEKKDFEKMIMRANEVLDTVLGPRSLDVIRQIRRERGMAEAWAFLVKRYTPKNTHLGMSLVRRKWEAMRKYPDVPMLEFFNEFKNLRQELADVGRPPDNVEQFDRLKLALLFDDQNHKDHWGPAIKEFRRDHSLEDYDFMDELETALTECDTEETLQSEVQIENGTFSSMQKDKQRENNRDDNRNKNNKNHAPTLQIAEPEAAMHAEAAGKSVAKDRTPAKGEAKATTGTNNKVTAQTRETAPPARDTRKCFNCGEWGHIASQCRGAQGENANWCDEEFGSDDDGVIVNICACATEEPYRATQENIPKYLDSACSSAMSPRTPEITSFKPAIETILLGGKGHKITSEGRGTMGMVEDIMVSDELRHTLFSVSKFDHDGKFTLFGGKKAYVFNERPTSTSKAIMSATLQPNNMYQVDDTTTQRLDETLADATELKTVNDETSNSTEHHQGRGSFGQLRAGGANVHNLKTILHRTPARTATDVAVLGNAAYYPRTAETLRPMKPQVMDSTRSEDKIEEEGAHGEERVQQSAAADYHKIIDSPKQDTDFREHVRHEHDEPWITVGKSRRRAGHISPDHAVAAVLPGLESRSADDDG